MFWRSVLESYVWGLDLPDSRADVHACCTVYKICNETHLEVPTAVALPGSSGGCWTLVLVIKYGVWKHTSLVCSVSCCDDQLRR